MNREQYRELIKMPKEKLEIWLTVFARENYQDGFDEGVERNMMAICRYLHDEFGWGDKRFSRLIELAKKDVVAMNEELVTKQEFRDGLVAEGCKSLKQLQLKGDPSPDRWRPVTEELPENTEKVLCCTETKKGQKNLIIGYYMDGLWRVGMNSNVIAWRILPPAYEEAKK